MKPFRLARDFTLVFVQKRLLQGWQLGYLRSKAKGKM